MAGYWSSSAGLLAAASWKGVLSLSTSSRASFHAMPSCDLT